MTATVVDASESRPSTGPLAVAIAAATVPIVVATTRAVAGGWLAIGDNANFLIRARDVLTEHHPLLGTWTSASLAVGVNVDNPGPLYFDILALPAKIGGHAGLAVGVATLNVAAVLLIALFAHRSTGRTGAIAAMAMCAALGWAMGSELLFDPWQPHGLLFSVLLFLVLVWAMLGGDMVALPFAVGVGSLIVQTHLSYAVIVPVLGIVGAAGLVRHGRRASGHRPKLGRMAVAALVVAALCWAQPVAEQLTGDGPGNLDKIATSVGGSESTVGGILAVRLVGDILAAPPWWARPSFSTAVVAGDAAPLREGRPPPTRHLPSTPMAALGLAVVLGASAALAARFRGTPAGRAGLAGVLIVGLAVGTTAIMPVTRFGVPQHQLRLLWPAGVFITWALVLGAVQRSRSHRWPAIAMAGTAVLLGAATLPHWNPRVGPSADVAAIPVARELISDLDAHHIDEPVLFDLAKQRFAEPYTAPVMAALQEQGVAFRVADEGMVGQLGPGRRADGTEAMRLFVREGDDALASATPATRIAFASSLSPQEQAELRSLRHRTGSLSADDRERLAALEHRWSRLTVGVFVDRMRRP